MNRQATSGSLSPHLAAVYGDVYGNAITVVQSISFGLYRALPAATSLRRGTVNSRRGTLPHTCTQGEMTR